MHAPVAAMAAGTVDRFGQRSLLRILRPQGVQSRSRHLSIHGRRIGENAGAIFDPNRSFHRACRVYRLPVGAGQGAMCDFEQTRCFTTAKIRVFAGHSMLVLIACPMC
jgi:hypothetical protein